MEKLKQKIEASWYRPLGWNKIFLPLSALFDFLSARRRAQYLSGRRASKKFSIPVVIVGNISVGGTGKSPLVIYLVEALKKHGFHPAVVSRGYGSKNISYPYWLQGDDFGDNLGDEAKMIAHRTQVPVVMDPDRVRALQCIVDQTRYPCDVVVSDDGMQHYALGRDIEIAVIDASRGLGNGHRLPLGPLRESVCRLEEVDFVVVNGRGKSKDLKQIYQKHDKCYAMEIVPMGIFALTDLSQNSQRPINIQGKVHGVAGIGNPERFFATLRRMGLEVVAHPFPDHHHFKADDLNFADDLPVVMTEKDAVKCQNLAMNKLYYLKIDTQVERTFIKQIISRLGSETKVEQG